MYTRRAELTAGLVVLAGIGALLALLYVTTGRGFMKEYSHWHVRFAQGESAPVEGDSVYYLGLEVGRVHKVRQASEVRRGEQLTAEDRRRLSVLPQGTPQEVREIYVIAELELGKDQRLPRGTTARLKNNLVTGMPSLLLVPGISLQDLPPEETHKKPILGQQSASLDDITAKIDALVEHLIQATGEIGPTIQEAKGFLQDLRKKLDALDTQAMSNEVLSAIASLKRSLGTIERDIDAISTNVLGATEDFKALAATGKEAVARAKDDLAAILASLKTASAKVDEVVQTNAPKVDEFFAGITGLGEKLKAAADDIQRFAQELRGIGPEARRVVIEVGSDLDSIFAILEDASRNILDATEDIRAHPWKLANKPDKDQIAFENLRVSTLTFVRAMEDMERAAARLQLILQRPDLNDPAIKAQLQSVLGEFEATRRRYQEAEARFAKLLGDASPRAPR
jgi:ABC-type transporter Mla subunit MlaD